VTTGLATRVGLFGGAFDPPHRTHVALAEAAIAQLNLDILHVVPTGQAWHKQRPLSTAEHRLAMCRLAFAGVRGVTVDARETLRDGPTYTFDTLQDMKALYPAAQLFLIMGGDQARAFHTWHRADELRRAATICVASRTDSKPIDGSHTSDKALQDLEFQAVQLPPSPLSATEIRDMTARGHCVAPLVFESVARYIDQHHLYRTA